MNEQHALSIARKIVAEGTKHHKTVSGAESCTGGWIAKLLTDIPGSSAVFCGACVTYTNAVKMNLLGVPPTVIASHTEVSYPCAEAMAEGARRAFDTDIAYSTTGYAGPDGGTEADPVGTVYVAVATKDGTKSHRLSLPQNATREEIRLASAVFVLELIEANLTPSIGDDE